MLRFSFLICGIQSAVVGLLIFTVFFILPRFIDLGSHIHMGKYTAGMDSSRFPFASICNNDQCVWLTEAHQFFNFFRFYIFIVS